MSSLGILGFFPESLIITAPAETPKIPGGTAAYLDPRELELEKGEGSDAIQQQQQQQQ